MAEAKKTLEREKQRKEEEEQVMADKEAEELQVLLHTPASQLAPPQRLRLVDLLAEEAKRRRKKQKRRRRRRMRRRWCSHSNAWNIA